MVVVPSPKYVSEGIENTQEGQPQNPHSVLTYVCFMYVYTQIRLCSNIPCNITLFSFAVGNPFLLKEPTRTHKIKALKRPS